MGKHRGLDAPIYNATRTMLIMLAKQIKLLPLKSFLEEIEDRELEGTDLVHKIAGLSVLKKMAASALVFQESLIETLPETNHDALREKVAR